MKPCTICATRTEVMFYFITHAAAVCEECASTIFFQQADRYSKNRSIYNLPKKEYPKKKLYPKEAVTILNYLFVDLLKTKKVPYTENKVPDTYLTNISNRINEGFTVDQFKAVCYTKWKEWKGDDRMKIHIHPNTLFLPTNFKKYVDALPEDFNPQNSKEQRELIKSLNKFGVRGIQDFTTDKLAKRLMDTGYDNRQFLNMYLNKKI